MTEKQEQVTFKFIKDEENILNSTFQYTDKEFQKMLQSDFGWRLPTDRVNKATMLNLLKTIKDHSEFLDYAYEYDETETTTNGTPALDYSEQFKQLQQLLISLQDEVSAAMKIKVESEGTIDYPTLSLYLTSGGAKDILFVVDEDGHKHCAKFKSANIRQTMVGEYIAIQAIMDWSTESAIVEGQYTASIPPYKGIKTFQELGLGTPDKELMNTLVARGKRYVSLVIKPSYMQYAGNLARKGWWSDQQFRSDGRVMVDYRTMRKIDPNYTQYHGQDRYAERDELRQIAFDAKLTDEVYSMLSPFVYGFSFVSKQWGELIVDNLSEVVFRDTAYDQLVLGEKKKLMIKALVENNDEGRDLVSGKGGGLIFLLNGTPGVGKTLTAEAIAEKLHKPLYIVGAGELGVSPSQLEANLRNILDTARFWNAVLLIDEADIFLEARSNNDIVRNAMVGIFLRMLEYYQGILFLTTNRASSIDGAFFSRISLSIHYEGLTAMSRAIVWKNILALYDVELSTEELATLSINIINGRQIKNCVRLANSLAAAEKRVMSVSDLNQVIDTITEFKEAVANEGDNGLNEMKGEQVNPNTLQAPEIAFEVGAFSDLA